MVAVSTPRSSLPAMTLALSVVVAGACDRRSKPAPAPVTEDASAAAADPVASIRLDDAPLDWTRPLPAGPVGGVVEPGYVGSNACKDCHKDLYSSYARHSMARTGLRPLAALDAKWLARIFDAGPSQPVVHERSGFSYKAFRKGSEYFVEEYVLAEDGSRVQSRVQPVTYAYSAGSYGMAFYFKQGSHLFQVPVDYFPKAQRWGLDPAAVEGNPRFSKALRSFCISCHADYPARRPGTDDVFVGTIAGGVGCERCHGPGEKHVASLRADDIVNPARLPAPRQLDVCTQCHESSYSGLRADRDEFSFRPGEPLASYRVNFVGDPQPADRFILLAHPERMVASACWKKSAGKLTCTSCHDPHKSSFEQPAVWWDARCNACHADRPCTETAEARAAGGGHCVPCHMRAGPPTSPPQVAITDHWIQRRPPPVRPGKDEPQHLVPWPDLVGEHATGEDVAALEAVAYANAGRRDEAERRADALAGKNLHVPWLYERLAGRFAERGRVWDIAEAYAAVLRFRPDDEGALLGYARAMLDRGAAGSDGALHALDRLLALDPDDGAALETKATFLFRTGRIEEARPLFVRAAATDPSSATAHVALAVLARREGHEPETVAELEVARRIQPGDAWILDRLREAYGKGGDAERVAGIDRARAHFIRPGAPSRTPASAWLPPDWQ